MSELPAKTTLPHLPPRNRDSHKNDYGHVLVVAGSTGMTGAASLCAQATLRAGAGLTTLACPKSLNSIFEIKLTEVMTIPMAETPSGSLSENALEEIISDAHKYDALAVGPGLSRDESTMSLVRSLCMETTQPLVLDADGLNAVADDMTCLCSRSGNLVVTPHEGEMSRLVGLDIQQVRADRINIAAKFAAGYGAVTVLKGPSTVVTDGKKVYQCPSGNPGMATAGSGDVLTGIITALIAQGMRPFGAACLGTYIHGVAGDIAAKNMGMVSLVAGDILDNLPEAFCTFDSLD